ncbi:MAG: fused MFS/spermidine synthase, partial [Acidobacteriota bacterium]
SMLIVGLGGGLTVEAVPASVADVHVVELEPEVVAANRQLAGERARDPLDDPRVTVHLNDARGALMLTGRTFDAIVSQPSHPWTAGASHLFTREFFALVDAHLAPDGVFVQWIGLRFVDASLLRSLIATLLDVFPHVEVYEPSPGGSLIFLAGQQALEVAPKAAALMRSDDPARAAWLRLGMAAPEDFLAAQRFDVDAARRFAGDAALVTDRRNLLKSRSARLRTGRLDSRFLAQLLAGEAAVDPSLPAERDALRIVQRHLRQPGGALTAAAIADAPSTPPRVRQAAHALIALAQGDGGAGPALERLLPAPGVALDRAGQEALYALMLRRRPAVTRQQAGAWATQIASDPVAAMIAEGWRLAALRKPGVLRARDAALARVPAAHTLFPAALELRVVWRQASGDAARLAEAYDLMALRMVHGVGQPAGHLRRARLAAQLGDPVRLRASMLDLRASMARREAPGVRRAVARLVADLPPELQRVARAALGEAVR